MDMYRIIVKQIMYIFLISDAIYIIFVIYELQIFPNFFFNINTIVRVWR